MACVDQIGYGGAYRNIKNYSVVWRDDEMPRGCGKEVDQRQQGDGYCRRTTRRQFRVKTEWKTH